jgi:integrase
MSIYERTSPPSPYWYIRFSWKGETVNQSSQVLIGKTAAERKASTADAEAIEVKLRAGITARQKGGFTSGMTLGDACTRYHDDVLMISPPVLNAIERGEDPAKISVVRNFISMGDRLCDAFGETRVLDDITDLMIVEQRDRMLKTGRRVATKGVADGTKTELRGQGLSVGSVNAYLRLLSSILGYAHKDWKTLAVRPNVQWFGKGKAPKVKKAKCLSDDQVDQLLAAARAYNGAGAHCERALLFLFNTGARRTEAFALTWPRIDLASNGPAHVHFIDQTKRDKDRFVQIPEGLRAMLQQMKAEQIKGGYKGDKVFAYRHPRNNSWVEPKGLESQLDAIRKAAGVPKFTQHIARHTFASRVLRHGKGARLQHVKELLGHEDIKTTQIYASYEQKDLDAVVSFLDAKWKAPSDAAASPAAD